ncbi:MAG: hypothetical protein IIV62_06960 [Anaerotignum sp.]|nr:hypothetical protein [Anaerotignum sp.]
MKDEKYQKLTEYLQKNRKTELLLTFAEIEEILGFSLDVSAFQYKEFWANCTASTKAYSWMDAGYEIVSLDLKEKTVLFRQKDWL